MAATPTVADSQSFPWLREEPPQSSERVALALEYPVHFTSEVFSWENLTLVRAIARRDSRRRHRIAVVIDRAVIDAQPCLLDDLERYVAFHRERLVCPEPVILDGTVGIKNRSTVERLQSSFDLAAIDAESCVVIVGGGALQDVAGYAAAMRGARMIRVPTTLFSQTAIPSALHSGFDGYRCFAPPFAVIDDFHFLQTLPARELAAGLAESIRIALSEDAALFGWLRLHAAALRDGAPALQHDLVRRVVSHQLARANDPFQVRPGLGQWAACQLEGELRYGEALALGCALDAVHSAACGVLDPEELEPIVRTIEALGLPTYHPGLESLRREPGLILDRIGHAIDAHGRDHELLLRAIDWLRHRR